MTEDEKKAIEYLMLMKDRMEFNRLGYVYGADSIDIILNLIKNQQKEIEIQKAEVILKQKVIDELVENESKNLVPKEAIREKIEWYKNQNNDLDDYTNEIEALEEILGE